jgi:hypothetical protein
MAVAQLSDPGEPSGARPTEAEGSSMLSEVVVTARRCGSYFADSRF